MGPEPKHDSRPPLAFASSDPSSRTDRAASSPLDRSRARGLSRASSRIPSSPRARPAAQAPPSAWRRVREPIPNPRRDRVRSPSFHPPPPRRLGAPASSPASSLVRAPRACRRGRRRTQAGLYHRTDAASAARRTISAEIAREISAKPGSAPNPRPSSVMPPTSAAPSARRRNVTGTRHTARWPRCFNSSSASLTKPSGSRSVSEYRARRCAPFELVIHSAPPSESQRSKTDRPGSPGA